MTIIAQSLADTGSMGVIFLWILAGLMLISLGMFYLQRNRRKDQQEKPIAEPSIENQGDNPNNY